MTNTAYEPSQDPCTKTLGKLGVSTGWFGPLAGADIAKHIQSNTKVVFLEPPGSVAIEVYDIPAIVAAVKGVAPDAIVIIDNTRAAGMLFEALDPGIDTSIQADTRYLISHPNGMVGTVVSSAHCWDQLRENAYLMGQMLDADTAYMTNRGLCTLSVRLRQHHESSSKVVEQLTSHPQVARVNHPALLSSKGHEFWKRDFTDSSGLFSFISNKKLNNEELAVYLDHFNLFSMTYSWGGFEPPILASRPEYIVAIRLQGRVDFSGAPVHLHIGLEGVDDLIADLAAGLARIK